MDFYLSNENCTKRLIEEFEKHNELIIAYDFDNTVYDFHNKGYGFEKIIELIRECKELGFYLIVYSCSKHDRYEFISNYLNDNNIPFDNINENSPNIDFAHGKLYYNILLDDRAGLYSAHQSLNECIKYIKNKRRTEIMIKNNYPATLLCDFYKVSHKEQYPKGTQKIYATWTPRTSRLEGVNEVIFFGLQAFIKEYLIEYFNCNFFNRKEEDVIYEYERVLKYTLGKSDVDSSHIKSLHKLGYLPIKIKAINEGMSVPIRVPMFTIENTVDEFFWVTNYLETLMSCMLWQPMTSATISKEYRKILDNFAIETIGSTVGVGFQGHDFSMRGMSSLESAKSSGAGHLLSFNGTDTIPAILYMEQFYNANIEKELIGTSIPATEHSVQCSYGQEDEINTYKRLINEVYSRGFVSIVSDTWDLWKVLTEYLPQLKEDIMSRDGKVVIRPDSGDPVKIICGDENSSNPHARKGVIEILWDIFGGTVTEQGYKLLDSHIGAIYGDAITIDRCKQICEKLKAKGFASTNMVYGIGSFTYQYNTRDTFGFALKTTYSIIDEEERFLFKNPITDNGVKKSQRGKVVVVNKDNKITYIDGLNSLQEINSRGNLLKTVFEDGELKINHTLKEIRDRMID